MAARERVRFILRADALKVGDLVLTPSGRWETVSGLDRGEAFSRSVRVVTDRSGPGFPWVLLNRHPVQVQRYRPAPMARAA